MEPTYRDNTVAFACATALAIHVLQSAGGRTGPPPFVNTTEAARKLVIALLAGPNSRFRDLFRIDQSTFHRLVSWLQANAGLRLSQQFLAEQKVMIVLWIFAHGTVQRNTAHRFGISQKAVSRIMAEVLPIFVVLHRAFVRLPEEDWLDPEIELNPRLNAFNGCIGAIDGTHIAAHVRLKHQLRWRDRKGHISQNVFAAVRINGAFSYVLAGAEGSINDSTLCAQAFGRSFKVPPNRYYVGDAGFGSRDGIVVPFPGVRYHLEDWRNAERPPQTRKELYNLRHARLRVVVERVFGQLKRRWKIIRVAAAEYSLRKQVQIVYAVTGLHSFVLAEHQEDSLTAEQRALMSLAKSRAQRVLGGRDPEYIRWQAAHAMWKNWQDWKNRTEGGCDI